MVSHSFISYQVACSTVSPGEDLFQIFTYAQTPLGCTVNHKTRTLCSPLISEVLETVP
jgi:hypothetical protein